MIHEVLYSSRSVQWPTPLEFFRSLDDEFHFDLDPCATPLNAKSARYFTKDQDGLSQDWATHTVFCNPPYGRSTIRWAQKCYEASLNGATVVLLAHARTDTRWFHSWVYHKADEIRFVRGRLKFGDSKQSAPFPSMIAIFKPKGRSNVQLGADQGAA